MGMGSTLGTIGSSSLVLVVAVWWLRAILLVATARSSPVDCDYLLHWTLKIGPETNWVRALRCPSHLARLIRTKGAY